MYKRTLGIPICLVTLCSMPAMASPAEPASARVLTASPTELKLALFADDDCRTETGQFVQSLDQEVDGVKPGDCLSGDKIANLRDQLLARKALGGAR